MTLLELIEPVVVAFRALDATSAMCLDIQSRYGRRDDGSLQVPEDLQDMYSQRIAQAGSLQQFLCARGLDLFGQAYINGLGARTPAQRATSRFSNGALDLYVLTSHDARVDPVKVGLTRMIDRYALPLTLRERDDPALASLLFSSTTPDGLFDHTQLDLLAEHTNNISVFVTDIRGGTGDYNQVVGKNPEEYYGAGKRHGIVFTLGGKKDLAYEEIEKAAAHEVVHVMLAGGLHHDIDYPPRTSSPFFTPDAPCLFYGSDHRHKRTSDPCAFLDAQLNMAVRGFNERSAAATHVTPAAVCDYRHDRSV